MLAGVLCCRACLLCVRPTFTLRAHSLAHAATTSGACILSASYSSGTRFCVWKQCLREYWRRSFLRNSSTSADIPGTQAKGAPGERTDRKRSSVKSVIYPSIKAEQLREIGSWLVLAIEREHTLHYLLASTHDMTRGDDVSSDVTVDSGFVTGPRCEIPLIPPGDKVSSEQNTDQGARVPQIRECIWQVRSCIDQLPASDHCLLIDSHVADLCAARVHDNSSRHPRVVMAEARWASLQSTVVALLLVRNQQVSMCSTSRLKSRHKHAAQSQSQVAPPGGSQPQLDQYLLLTARCFAAQIRAAKNTVKRGRVKT